MRATALQRQGHGFLGTGTHEPAYRASAVVGSATHRDLQVSVSRLPLGHIPNASRSVVHRMRQVMGRLKSTFTPAKLGFLQPMSHTEHQTYKSVQFSPAPPFGSAQRPWIYDG
jgi:hypothetical protein